MAGPGIEPGTLASLVRCSTTELSRPISTVQIARTTTLLTYNLEQSYIIILILLSCVKKIQKLNTSSKYTLQANNELWLSLEENLVINIFSLLNSISYLFDLVPGPSFELLKLGSHYPLMHCVKFASNCFGEYL